MRNFFCFPFFLTIFWSRFSDLFFFGIFVQLPSKRYNKCCLPSITSIICILLWWWHRICFPWDGLLWSYTESSYYTVGNTKRTQNRQWKRWVDKFFLDVRLQFLSLIVKIWINQKESRLLNKSMQYYCRNWCYHTITLLVSQMQE